MKNKQLLCLLLVFALLLPVMGGAGEAKADTYLGIVTITHTYPVNLRSGGSATFPVVGTGQPGDTFTCTGIDATGWYQILLPDGRTAYVSPLLSALTSAPPATPTPAPVFKAVSVYYKSTTGTLLYLDSVNCTLGTNYISANDARVPAGYALVGSRSVAVTVYSDRSSYPAYVTFTYSRSAATPTPVPLYKAVSVYYRSTSGTLLYLDSVNCYLGTNYVSANDARVPAGYSLIGARSVAVTVYSDRSSYPAYVTFTYSPAAATPTPVPAVFAHVLIYYRNTYGSLLTTSSADLSPGTRVIYANDALVPAGYTLVGSRSAVVSVSSSGVATPWSVTFTYASAATAVPTATPRPSVTVPVYYMSSGGALLYTTYATCYTGSNTVYANDAYVPAGYTLTGTRARTVTVYASGSFSPASIVYTYAPAATPTPYVTVNVPVYYKTSLGALLHTTTAACRTGTNYVTANDSYVPAGYTLTSARQVTVTVSTAGYASPGSVTFTYKAPAPPVTPTPVPPPVTVEVPVEYMDETSTVFYSETVYCVTGFNTVVCNTGMAPAGYTLISSGSVNVTVSAGGVATPSNVTFVFSSTGATPAPTEAVGNDVLPEFQKIHFSGTAPVYSGPDTTYYRANNSKASVSSGAVRLYGSDGDWALIGYGLSNGDYRIGYVALSALPSGVMTEPLLYANKPAVTNRETKLTDDPVVNVKALYYLPAGTSVTFLGMSDNTRRWAMVELFSEQLGGVMVRGFVRAEHLDIME